MTVQQRYDSGMTVKITVSLPDELVEAARTAVAETRATSVSSYVASAMREYERTDSLGKLLDEMDAQHGPPGPEVDAWAREQFLPDRP
jgi:Arc/MetJ-type ribon-helix-helix transcriptional regulator